MTACRSHFRTSRSLLSKLIIGPRTGKPSCLRPDSKFQIPISRVSDNSDIASDDGLMMVERCSVFFGKVSRGRSPLLLMLMLMLDDRLGPATISNDIAEVTAELDLIVFGRTTRTSKAKSLTGEKQHRKQRIVLLIGLFATSATRNEKIEVDEADDTRAS